VTATEESESNRALDALLASYAAGTLAPALHVLVASHLALRSESRRFVASLEAANGAEMDRANPVPLCRRDSILDAILSGPSRPDAEPAIMRDPVLPAPLVGYLGRGLKDIPWRRLIPGVRRHVLEAEAGGEAALFWIRPGRKTPSHTHEGVEVTLVLAGGIQDVTGHYRRGDIAVADSDIDHQPITDADEDCICFTVADAPRRLTGPLGRWLHRLAPGGGPR
jgi:putative transcriptional regulator